MSKEKVEYNKQQKANRKSEVKKRKVTTLIRRIAISVVCIAAVAWIGFSVYQKVEAVKAADTTIEHTEVDLSPLADYLSDLDAE